jgi:hypothetical protein
MRRIDSFELGIRLDHGLVICIRVPVMPVNRWFVKFSDTIVSASAGVNIAMSIQVRGR